MVNGHFGHQSRLLSAGCVQSHQAAMDEKVAEVANLTLRLREMSGKVMWFEAQQNEKNAEVAAIQEQMEAAEQRIRELEFKGVRTCSSHLLFQYEDSVSCSAGLLVVPSQVCTAQTQTTREHSVNVHDLHSTDDMLSKFGNCTEVSSWHTETAVAGCRCRSRPAR